MKYQSLATAVVGVLLPAHVSAEKEQGIRGCYWDNLPEDLYYVETEPYETAVEACLDRCWDLGMRVTGLTKSVDCWCGNTVPSYEDFKVAYPAMPSCSAPCAKYENFCGGDTNEFTLYEQYEFSWEDESGSRTYPTVATSTSSPTPTPSPSGPNTPLAPPEVSSSTTKTTTVGPDTTATATTGSTQTTGIETQGTITSGPETSSTTAGANPIGTSSTKTPGGASGTPSGSAVSSDTFTSNANRRFKLLFF